MGKVGRMEGELDRWEEKVHFYFYAKVHFLRTALFSVFKGPLCGGKEIKEIFNKQVQLNVCGWSTVYYLFIYLSGLFITSFRQETSCFDPGAPAHSGHLTLFTFLGNNVYDPLLQCFWRPVTSACRRHHSQGLMGLSCFLLPNCPFTGGE